MGEDETYLRELTSDEIVYAKEHESTSIPLELTAADTIADLLEYLVDAYERDAGTSDRPYMDRAEAWVKALRGQERNG